MPVDTTPKGFSVTEGEWRRRIAARERHEPTREDIEFWYRFAADTLGHHGPKARDRRL